MLVKKKWEQVCLKENSQLFRVGFATFEKSIYDLLPDSYQGTKTFWQKILESSVRYPISIINYPAKNENQFLSLEKALEMVYPEFQNSNQAMYSELAMEKLEMRIFKWIGEFIPEHANMDLFHVLLTLRIMSNIVSFVYSKVSPLLNFGLEKTAIPSLVKTHSSPHFTIENNSTKQLQSVKQAILPINQKVSQQLKTQNFEIHSESNLASIPSVVYFNGKQVDEKFGHYENETTNSIPPHIVQNEANSYKDTEISVENQQEPIENSTNQSQQEPVKNSHEEWSEEMEWNSEVENSTNEQDGLFNDFNPELLSTNDLENNQMSSF